MLKKIDTHHHLWKYSPSEYSWIDDSMAVLKRDYLPFDLATIAAEHQVAVTIVVQARQNLAETEWLLEHAKSSPLIAGVTGWLPLVDSTIEKLVSKYCENPYLKGIRHVLQDESDSMYMDRSDFNHGISVLRKYSLLYEVLVYHHQLPQTLQFIDRHPEQTFVLDHGGKPGIAQGEIAKWGHWIKEIGRRETVYCKVSGLITEAKWNTWSLEDLRPYLDILWDSFGPKRLIFGSDWPVCLVAGSYGQWVKSLETYTSTLSSDEQQDFFFRNAKELYRISSDQGD